ncbi:unnamed protein product [Colias eurytheme]|nr:unnamed protein product [Colias eurytheme]
MEGNRDFNDCVEENQLYPSVKKHIGNIIKKEGYISFKVHAEALSADGGNFLGKLFQVKIVGKTAEGLKETNLFIKQAPIKNALDNYLMMKEAYLREVFFYTELNVLYKKLQTDANIEPHEMLKTGNCYDESSIDAIIMEDLNMKGYKVLFRMDVVPLKFAELAIKEIAKFHALSFVVQEKMPEYFIAKKNSLKPVIHFNDFFEKFTYESVKNAVKNFKECDKEKILNNYSVIFSKYAKYMTDTVSSVNCFCHGDFRPNNVLAKEIDGQIIDVIPIDYQLFFYGSPITDLIFFLYLSTDRAFRKEHENNLKEVYYSTLKDFLHHFDINIETVFPRKLFEDDYENIREYGFCLSLIMLPFCFCDESDLPDFENCGASDMKLELNERYYPRLDEIYDEFKDVVNYNI